MVTREVEDVSERRPSTSPFFSVRGRGGFIETVKYDGNGTLERESRSHDYIGTKKFIDENPHRTAKILSLPGIANTWTRPPSAEGYGSLTQAEADELTATSRYLDGVLDIFEETFEGLSPEEQEIIAADMDAWALDPPTIEDFSAAERTAISSARQKNDDERRPASYFAEMAHEQLRPAPEVPQGIGQVAAAGALAA